VDASVETSDGAALGSFQVAVGSIVKAAALTAGAGLNGSWLKDADGTTYDTDGNYGLPSSTVLYGTHKVLTGDTSNDSTQTAFLNLKLYRLWRHGRIRHDRGRAKRSLRQTCLKTVGTSFPEIATPGTV